MTGDLDVARDPYQRVGVGGSGYCNRIATIATQGGTMEDASKVTGYYLRVWLKVPEGLSLRDQKGDARFIAREIERHIGGVGRVEIAEVRDG